MIPDWLSLVDIAYVAGVVLFGMSGFHKGFSGQVAHFLTTIALAAFLFFAYPSIYSYFGRIFRNLNETYMMWLILAGVAVLTLMVFLWVSKVVEKVLKTQISERSDRFYGTSLGLLRGALVALLIMVFLVMLGPPHIYDKFRSKSQVGKLVCYELVPRIQPHLTRSDLEERVDKLKEALLHQEEAGVLE
jgi:uncharacterized membrane protein required for colicin V production